MVKCCWVGIVSIFLLHRKLVSDSDFERNRSCIKCHEGWVGGLRSY